MSTTLIKPETYFHAPWLRNRAVDQYENVDNQHNQSIINNIDSSIFQYSVAAASERAEEIKDPMCDPDNPKVVHFEEISAAAYKIRSGISHTSCTRSNQLSELLGMDLYFKNEFMQFTGSFKDRGARYALMKLDKEQRKIGVIAASAGNHALALSYHGKQLNIPVTVVMPVVAPLMKISRCRSFGAQIIIDGGHLRESKQVAMKLVAERGYTYINGYDHPDILAGAGTVALEILNQLDDIDAIVVPVGGAGLIAGMAVATNYLQPGIQIIGVEPKTVPSLTEALKAGKPVKSTVKSTLADGLAVSQVGVNAFATCKSLVSKVCTVDEAYIALAVLRLIEVEKAVVEGGGAAPLAALLAGRLPELKGKRVVIPLTGGNIDTTALGRAIERGLAVDNRLCRFSVVVSDRPGGIAELAALCAAKGVSIKDTFHERAWTSTDIFSVRVKVIVETNDKAHCEELEAALREHYEDVIFNDKLV